ncbi:MAG: Mbeg1-like protein [Anaeroplasmataceae bacterium]
MKKNIIKYLKTNKSFNISKFNEVDALVLSQLAYIDFFNYQEGFDFVNIRRYLTKEKMKTLVKSTYLPKKNIKFLNNLSKSDRFKKLEVGFIYNRLDETNVSQFTCMCYRIDKLYFVAYRGTDTSVIGLKEDFNMSLYDTLPGQDKALKYLTNISKFISDEDELYVGGHSKGGNFALFASIFAPISIQEKIKVVYNFDGPGYKNNIFLLNDFERISHKVKSYVPKDALIGVLLNHAPNKIIVKSSAIGGLFQHDPFAWIYKNDKFVTFNYRTLSSISFEVSITELLNTSDEYSKMQFINDLFELFEVAGVSNIMQFRKNFLIKSARIISKFETLDDNEKKIFRKFFKKFIFRYIRSFIINLFNIKKLRGKNHEKTSK